MASEGTIPGYGKFFGTQSLQKWCLEHSTIPADLSQPFVLSHNITHTLPAHFSIFVTNRLLLSKLDRIECLQVDAAHKMIIGKHKVFVAGGSDANRTFHPVLIGLASHENQQAYCDLFESLRKKSSVYTPKAVMADGAAYITAAVNAVFGSSVKRLMCYFHMVS